MKLLNKLPGNTSRKKKTEDSDRPLDSISRHKEEIFREARKLIYPLSHSKHYIAIISILILLGASLLFVLVSGFFVYQLQSESNFIYQTSRIIPFPIGKVDDNYLRYEEYLFELRRNKHFRTTQKDVDFTTPEGQAQLKELRAEVLDQVIEYQLIENLAKKHDLKATEEEINEQITVLRDQANFSLGGDNEVEDANRRFEQILEEFYNWSDKDLRRIIELQILKQKLTPYLDLEGREKAENILSQIKSGELSFTDAVSQSDDRESKEEGGKLGVLDRKSPIISDEFTEELLQLNPGETSIIDSQFGFHVMRVSRDDKTGELTVAHILIAYQDIDKLLEVRRKSAQIDIYGDFENYQSKK